MLRLLASPTAVNPWALRRAVIPDRAATHRPAATQATAARPMAATAVLRPRRRADDATS